MTTPAPGPAARGAVVVVAYASAALLERTLVPLTRALDRPGGTGDQAGAPFDVVVVDNHSTDAERAALTHLATTHGWDLVLRPNDGFGAGMRAGVARARERGCDAVVLLNPDVTTDPATVTALLERARRDPDILLSPRILHPDGTSAFAEGTLDLARGLTRTRPPLDPSLERWLSGACLALATRLWDATGGLAAEYFMYWEDLELSHRVLAAGGRLVVAADLAVTHDVGGTQGPAADGAARAPKSALYRYYNTRNRLLFARRNLSRADACRWVLHAPAYARRVALRDGRRALLRRPGTTLWPVVRGSVAGVRIVLTGR